MIHSSYDREMRDLKYNSSVYEDDNQILLDKSKGRKYFYMIAFVLCFELLIGWGNFMGFVIERVSKTDVVVSLGFDKYKENGNKENYRFIELKNDNLYKDEYTVEKIKEESSFHLGYFESGEGKNVIGKKVTHKVYIDSDYEYYKRRVKTEDEVQYNNGKSDIFNALTTRIVYKDPTKNNRVIKSRDGDSSEYGREIDPVSMYMSKRLGTWNDNLPEYKNKLKMDDARKYYMEEQN